MKKALTLRTRLNPSMFGISFSEIILIGLIAIIVFGPEQLPIFARKLGHLLGKWQRLQQMLRHEFYQHSGALHLQQLQEEFQQNLTTLKAQLRPQSSQTMVEQVDDFDETTPIQHYYCLYQPELDFERQPELFDEEA